MSLRNCVNANDMMEKGAMHEHIGNGRLSRLVS